MASPDELLARIKGGGRSSAPRTPDPITRRPAAGSGTPSTGRPPAGGLGQATLLVKEQADHAETRRLLEEAERQRDENQRKLDDSQAEVRRLSNEVRTKDEARHTVELELARLQAAAPPDVARLQKEHAQATIELTAARQEIEQLKREGAQAALDRDIAQQKLEVAEENLRTTTLAFNTANAEVERLTRELRDAQEKLDTLTGYYEQLEAEAAEAQDLLQQALEGKTVSDQEAIEAKEAKEIAERERGRAEQQVAHLEAANQQLTRQLSGANSSLRAVTGERDRLADENSQLRDRVAARGRDFQIILDLLNGRADPTRIPTHTLVPITVDEAQRPVVAYNLATLTATERTSFDLLVDTGIPATSVNRLIGYLQALGLAS